MKKFLLLALLLSPNVARADQDPFTALPPAVMAYHQAANGTRCLYGEDFKEWVGISASAYQLKNGWRLYLVPCGAGAYQTNFRAYYAKNDSTQINQLLVLDWTSAAGVFATDFLMSAEFDVNTGILRTHSVGRSLGDCGSAGVYRILSEEYEVNVKTIRIQAKEYCDGKMNPWPVVYPKH